MNDEVCWKCQGAGVVEEPICGHCLEEQYHTSCDDTFTRKIPCDACKK